jgi:ribulose-5-phosphate 4-epimerase/fuculose-1-phosphate aldolase
MAHAQPREDIRLHVTEEEWRVRVDLAACYRLVDLFGMSDMIYNHITARVPGPQEHVLINPFGLHYSEITASSLIKIDLDGNVVLQADCSYGINGAGYVIHSAIHMARPDVGCAIHTHTRAATAVSAMKFGLLPLSQTSLQFLDRIGYHDFEGPAFDLGERERLAQNLGSHNVLILRNHGLLVCGASVPHAFLRLERVESACKIQIDALSAGFDNLNFPSEHAQTKTAELFNNQTKALTGLDYGVLEWAALLRRLDRESPGFRM